MRCFTGIVPTEEIYNTVSGIQNKYGDNRLEPHITITPPVTVKDPEQWLKAIEEVCKRFSPINVSLPTTGQFGNRTLFIDVSSPALADLFYALKPQLSPFETANNKDEDNRKYHPHLTMARSWCGFSRQAFTEMKSLANDYLSNEPKSFVAAALRVYYKPVPQGRFEPYKDIPFTTVN